MSAAFCSWVCLTQSFAILLCFQESLVQFSSLLLKVKSEDVQGVRVYLDTLRECYEAYVIYNFFMYLLAYLHEEYGDISAYFSTKEPVSHTAGLQWFLKPWPMGAEFFWKCKAVYHSSMLFWSTVRHFWKHEIRCEAPFFVEWFLVFQGVLSYVIFRPLMTAIGVFATLCNVYGDSSFRFDRVYIYTAAITNISQAWSHTSSHLPPCALQIS